MMTSRQLTAVLTRTLEVKAEQAIMAGPSPSERSDEPPAYPEMQPPAPRRRRLLSAAAVLAVLALGAVITTALHRDSTEQQVSTAALGDRPDGWLVPTGLPAGMQLWGIEYSSSPADERLSEPGPTIPQLFGDPDQGRAIYIVSHQYDAVPDTAEQVTVRGRTGQAGPSWDVEENDVGDAIAWEERGAPLTALYKGTSRAQAIAVLDSLEWRSDDPADGFAPPSDPAWALRGEVDSWPSAGYEATFAYSQGVPSYDPTDGRPDFWIHTEASSAVSAGYLAGWYTQGAEAGGGERPLSSFDDTSGRLELYWSDGRSTIIEPLAGSRAQVPSRQELERIANSLTVASEADLGAMQDEARANIAALPVVAAGETTIGRLEVRGEGDFVRLCLDRPADGPLSCAIDTIGSGTEADWMIDGTWYVAMASTTNDFRIVGSDDPSRAPDAGELPAETTTAGEWTFHLVTPPPGIDQVCRSSTDGNTVSCNHIRPDSEFSAARQGRG
jgi:hypothetical protein